MQTNCTLCPRECHVNRISGKAGVCGVSGKEIYIAKVSLHQWEEPCISGERGSGTVFFSGCPLRCVYCQNATIAHDRVGKAVSVQRLTEIFLELQFRGAHNINLVTPTHYTPQIISALERAKEQGCTLPIVYNCSGYEKVETLKLLEGIVDIYLTDFKYMQMDLAADYSNAPDYPTWAKSALEEMVRQQPKPVFEDSLMKKGVIVRHLLLPNCVQNAKQVVEYVFKKYGNQVYLSLMNQYTPLVKVEKIKRLNRKVTEREYDRLLDYALSLGVEQAFMQEGKTADESFIPPFDFEGVEK